jgi:hypothetical protein
MLEKLQTRMQPCHAMARNDISAQSQSSTDLFILQSMLS